VSPLVSPALQNPDGIGSGGEPAHRNPEVIFLLGLHLIILTLAPVLLWLGNGEIGTDGWVVFGFLCVYTLGLYLLVRGRPIASVRAFFGYAVLAGDLLLVTLLIWNRGDLAADTYSLYYLVIVGAGIAFGVVGSLGVALTAGLLYGGAVWLAAGADGDFGRVAVRAIYFCLTGILAAYLAARERQHRAARAESQRLLSELQEEHTRLKVHARDMSRRAVTDGLTQLYNQIYFHQRLEQELARARRYGRPLSLLMLDIDDFKLYNDTFGHLDGDRVLAKIAAVLTGAVRNVDVACRYGGEEFAIILPETGLESARAAGERIRCLVEQAFSENGGEHPEPLTVSIGVASFPVHASARLDLIDAADRALYLSKRSGKNRVNTHSVPRTLSQP